jgi:hypothetical protein
MEPEGSLLQSQVSTTCPYPDPAWSSPHPQMPLLKIHLNIIFPSTLWNPKVHYCSHKCPPPVPIQFPLDPVHIPTCHSWRFNLILSSHLRYGTRRCITAFSSARCLSLPWAGSTQSIPPHPTSGRSILILSSHLRLSPHWFLFLRFPHENPVHVSPIHNKRYTPLFIHYSTKGNWLKSIKCLSVGLSRRWKFLPKIFVLI